MNFPKFLRTTFLQNTSRRPLLKMDMIIKVNSFYVLGKSTKLFKLFILIIFFMIKVLVLILLSKNILKLILKTTFLIKTNGINKVEDI